ncbi:MAG: stage 0 sporulation protein, partial [Clostridia bacterium]|nr:stage 0 sporulation protein [Clostridia bacterium]
CLKYEQEAYEALLKETPNCGAIVNTPAGRGTVVSTNLLKGLAQVRLEGEADNTVSEFKVSELTVIKDGGKRNQEPEIDLSSLKELEE